MKNIGMGGLAARMGLGKAVEANRKFAKSLLESDKKLILFPSNSHTVFLQDTYDISQHSELYSGESALTSLVGHLSNVANNEMLIGVEDRNRLFL